MHSVLKSPGVQTQHVTPVHLLCSCTAGSSLLFPQKTMVTSLKCQPCIRNLQPLRARNDVTAYVEP